MKKQLSASTKTLVFASVLFWSIVSCKKETTNQNANTELSQVSTSSEDNSINGFIDKIVGTYSMTGTRKLYKGNVADSMLYGVNDLSLYPPKTVTQCFDCGKLNTVVCDYANLGGNNWQYILSFKPAQQTFAVKDNDIMESEIQPGSFIVYDKSYDPVKKVIYIKTGYINATGDGRITEETLTWISK